MAKGWSLDSEGSLNRPGPRFLRREVGVSTRTAEDAQEWNEEHGTSPQIQHILSSGARKDSPHTGQREALDAHVLMPEPVTRSPDVAKTLCRCDRGKDLEVGDNPGLSRWPSVTVRVLLRKQTREPGGRARDHAVTAGQRHRAREPLCRL